VWSPGNFRTLALRTYSRRRGWKPFHVTSWLLGAAGIENHESEAIGHCLARPLADRDEGGTPGKLSDATMNYRHVEGNSTRPGDTGKTTFKDN
jgi:hypothetical protein